MNEKPTHNPEYAHILEDVNFSHRGLHLDVQNVFASLGNIKYLAENKIEIPQMVIDEKFLKYNEYVREKHPEVYDQIMEKAEEEAVLEFNQLVDVCNSIDWNDKNNISEKISKNLETLSALYAPQ